MAEDRGQRAEARQRLEAAVCIKKSCRLKEKTDPTPFSAAYLKQTPSKGSVRPLLGRCAETVADQIFIYMFIRRGAVGGGSFIYFQIFIIFILDCSFVGASPLSPLRIICNTFPICAAPLFVSLCVCLSQSVCSSLSLSVRLSVCLSVSFSVYLLSICLTFFLSLTVFLSLLYLYYVI